MKKTKLDNARILQRNYFIDPEDKEFKETKKNARKKLETPMVPLCLAKPARRVSMGRPVARQMISNQNLRVSWKPVNPHDCVWKNLYQIIMRTTMQEHGDNSLQHYNLVHKIYSYASSHEDTRSKSSSR